MLVVGRAPLAVAIARALGRDDRHVVLASPTPAEGPFLWRHAHPDTGEGMRAAAAGVERVWLVADGTEALGARAVVDALPGVLVGPMGALPAAPDAWGRLEVGACWGRDEPLVAAWSATVAAGAHLWTADPGPIPVVSMPDAVAAAVALAETGGHWRLPGAPARLDDLAAALSAWHRRPLRVSRVPLALAMRRAGVDASRVRAWLRASPGDPDTPGWQRPPSCGPAGWVDGLPRATAGSAPH